MKILTDPKEKIIRIKTTSALVSSKKTKDDKFNTAIIRLYHVNNPHKKQVFPHTVYEFTNTEKIRFRRLNVTFYTEGSDVVLNYLEELNIQHEGKKVVLRGYQYEAEKSK